MTLQSWNVDIVCVTAKVGCTFLKNHSTLRMNIKWFATKCQYRNNNVYQQFATMLCIFYTQNYGKLNRYWYSETEVLVWHDYDVTSWEHDIAVKPTRCILLSGCCLPGKCNIQCQATSRMISEVERQNHTACYIYEYTTVVMMLTVLLLLYHVVP